MLEVTQADVHSADGAGAGSDLCYSAIEVAHFDDIFSRHFLARTYVTDEVLRRTVNEQSTNHYNASYRAKAIRISQ